MKVVLLKEKDKEEKLIVNSTCDRIYYNSTLVESIFESCTKDISFSEAWHEYEKLNPIYKKYYNLKEEMINSYNGNGLQLKEKKDVFSKSEYLPYEDSVVLCGKIISEKMKLSLFEHGKTLEKCNENCCRRETCFFNAEVKEKMEKHKNYNVYNDRKEPIIIDDKYLTNPCLTLDELRNNFKKIKMEEAQKKNFENKEGNYISYLKKLENLERRYYGLENKNIERTSKGKYNVICVIE